MTGRYVAQLNGVTGWRMDGEGTLKHGGGGCLLHIPPHTFLTTITR